MSAKRGMDHSLLESRWRCTQLLSIRREVHNAQASMIVLRDVDVAKVVRRI